MEGFSEEVVRLLTDVEYSALQAELLVQPEKGKLIQETGGARKIRVNLTPKQTKWVRKMVEDIKDGNL